MHALVVLVAVAVSSLTPASPADVLHKLFADDWERQMREDPLAASYLGDRRYNDKWPDVSLAALDKSDKEDGDEQLALSKIDRSALSDDDKLNADLFAD